MASDGDNTAQHVNKKFEGSKETTENVSGSASESAYIDTCVICLDRIVDKAIALPCRHDKFDFSCLGTWVQQSQTCPLCKAEVKALKYDVELDKTGTKIFYLPNEEGYRRRPLQAVIRRRVQAQNYHPYARRPEAASPSHGRRRQSELSQKEDHDLEVRKRVYQDRMFSAYVGANRISRYRNITPASFVTSQALVTRAKAFIRRELQVFNFLNPSTTASSSSAPAVSGDRRANNAEFLLEYIIGILKSIDLKGSTGQAEELLKDFLGRENARLFLHELEAWLRSPYERLNDWDRHVQYGRVINVLH